MKKPTVLFEEKDETTNVIIPYWCNTRKKQMKYVVRMTMSEGKMIILSIIQE